MNTLNCTPVIFGPHVTPHCPASSWWTPWHIAFVIAAAWAVAALAVAAVRRLRCREDRMSRADRAAWRTARTLEDIGEMTACWLEGIIASHPGYCGPSDIEDPALVPLLARLNRAGFVTECSQPGSGGTGQDGGRWKQRAAVEGYASAPVALRLRFAAQEAGMHVIAYGPQSLPRWRYRDERAVAVTRTDGGDPASPARRADGCDYTWFGTQAPRRHVRSKITGYGICRRAAVKALCQSWQVTIIDPEWGRQASPLWDVLDAEFRAAPRRAAA
jgi:hypothetical protein